jgi:hypothetical protein
MKTFENKIIYLSRLLDSYAKLLTNYNKAEVKQHKEIISIKLYNTKNNFYKFDIKEVPVEDIDKIINSYKNKFRLIWENKNLKK